MNHASKTPHDQLREIRKLVQDASDLLHQAGVALESLEERLEDYDRAGEASATADAES